MTLLLTSLQNFCGWQFILISRFDLSVKQKMCLKILIPGLGHFQRYTLLNSNCLVFLKCFLSKLNSNTKCFFNQSNKKNLIECVTKWSLAIYYSFKLSLLGYVLSEQKFSLSTSFSATFSHSMSSLFVCPGQINCLCPLRRKPEQA